MTAWRRIRCTLGLHLWSYAHVIQMRSSRIVWRECWFCGCKRTVKQDVWSEPERATRIVCDNEPPAWTDRVRDLARGCGGAA